MQHMRATTIQTNLISWNSLFKDLRMIAVFTTIWGPKIDRFFREKPVNFGSAYYIFFKFNAMICFCTYFIIWSENFYAMYWIFMKPEDPWEFKAFYMITKLNLNIIFVDFKSICISKMHFYAFKRPIQYLNVGWFPFIKEK